MVALASVKKGGVHIFYTWCPVQFEMTEQTREAVLSWIRLRGLNQGDYLFPSRIHTCPHLTTR